MRPRPQMKSQAFIANQLFYKDVGQRVKEARIGANNMTQKALAISVGLTRTSLTNIEKGRQKILLHTFSNIADALSVTINDLVPKNSKTLKNLGVNLPANMAPEERGFVERAITSGGIYETKSTAIHSNKRHTTSSRRRNIGSSG